MTAAQPKHRFRITFDGSDVHAQRHIEFDSTADDLLGVRGEVIVAVHRHLSPAVGRPVEVTMTENERGAVTVGGVRLCRFTVLQIVRIDVRGSKDAWKFVKGDILLYLDADEWMATPGARRRMGRTRRVRHGVAAYRGRYVSVQPGGGAAVLRAGGLVTDDQSPVGSGAPGIPPQPEGHR